jgi:hypothetical protein
MSDLLIQMPYHLTTMAIVYAAIALPALLAGGWLRKASSSKWMQAAKVVMGTSAGSVLFFVSTNLAVWLFDGMYALNAAGFAACFAAAVPFFKTTIAGDLGFALLLFGGYALVSKLQALRHSKLATA